LEFGKTGQKAGAKRFEGSRGDPLRIMSERGLVMSGWANHIEPTSGTRHR
jgi:hypothetical protein